MVQALDQLLGKEPHEDESWNVAVPGHCHCPCPAYLVWVMQGCALVGGSTAPPVPEEQPAAMAAWHGMWVCGHGMPPRRWPLSLFIENFQCLHTGLGLKDLHVAAAPLGSVEQN